VLKLQHGKSRHGYETCMEETRVDILQDINKWIDNVQGPNLFWLYGHPGTGKSTIATTVKDQLQAAGRLGSSFFFRQQDSGVQTPESLWCSIAFDLAQKYPTIQRVVVDQLKIHDINPDSDSKIIHHQLIVPLLVVDLQTEPKKLPVVIIDALDECGGRKQDTSALDRLLSTLSTWQTLQTQVKIFVTSRDEGNIGYMLGKGGLSPRILEVGHNVSQNSSQDIKKYFKYSFNQICESPGCRIKGPWPTESQLQLLTDTAAGLFIWASTVIKLVKAGPPEDELDQVLKTTTLAGTPSLTQLYNGILTSKFTTPLQLTWFTNVTGAILVARTPLSLEDFCKLFPEMKSSSVQWACEQLKSVLDIQEGLQFVHKSFVDFLVNLPADSEFHFDRAHHEQRFAAGCFLSLESLHFNMGNVETSYLQNDDIPGLIGRIPSHLKYSNQFWAAHLTACRSGTFPPNRIAEFLKSKLLYWLEVMSITRSVGWAAESLESLLTWCTVCGCYEDLRKQGKDALSFVRYFATCISTAVPHIYLSALVFAPSTSITHKTYLMEMAGVLKLNTGGEFVWPSLQGVLRGHKDSVTCVAFSPNGRHIVSGSSDNTVYIWDSESQQQIGQPLSGHADPVWSVAFSPNGRHIVSGSWDNTVRIWDSESQQQIGQPLSGHADPVWSVAFSPNGRHIVSGSEDKTVRIWDSESQQQIGQPLSGHANGVSSVAFSPNGRHIVSGSLDKTIRIWDSEMLSVAFSPNGRHIVSGSQDKTVCIWDSESQQQIGQPLSGHANEVWSVAFSPNGRHIVSGSSDDTVRIWDSESQQQIGQPLSGHADPVWSVAFSPNGRHIVSGSEDKTVRIWDSESQQQIGQPLSGHANGVSSVAFSPNGRHIVSGSLDKTIRIWDSESQQQIGQPLSGHANGVSSVAFSPNGRHIVSGSWDNTVRIWDSESQQQIGQPLSGHANGV
ncbi:WD40-repeat-containing domain protein, partial [Mycena leptocephala]